LGLTISEINKIVFINLTKKSNSNNYKGTYTTQSQCTVNQTSKKIAID